MELGLFDRVGRLWRATARGLIADEAGRVRRIDRHRGLLEEEVLELVIDEFDRVWARGRQGLAVIRY